MRRKMEAVLSFECSDDGLPKVIRDYRARYRAISQVLGDNPEILSAVHQDLRHFPRATPRAVRAITPPRTSCGPCSSSTSKGSPSARRSSASAAIRSGRTSCECGSGR